MFFVLFAISRFLLYNESQVTAAPLLSAANGTLYNTTEEVSCTCTDPCNLRTIWDIVWGSAATIFLCTWIAIHPNIPAPTDPWLVITFRRVRLWIYALLVPEMVIFWAMRQWIAARTISQRYRDRGWTQTHGFFIQMGGFMLYEGDSPVHILSVTEFEDLVQKGEIEFPDISEQEIKDKSKGDMISKGIVVLQTSWFIIQCIARAFQKLAITELELVTLSFCALNGLMYYLWWNKPLDVCCTVRVCRKTVSVPDISTRRSNPSASPQEHSSLFTSFVKLNLRTGRDYLTLYWTEHLQDKIRSNVMHIWILPWAIIKWTVAVLLMIFVFTWGCILLAAVSPILQLSGTEKNTNTIKPNAMRVPEFYTYQTDHPHLTHRIRMISGAAAMGFGGIHCIAWSFHFPSHIDQLLWRISASIITGSSALVTIAVVGQARALNDKWENWFKEYTREDGILNALMLNVSISMFMAWTSVLGLIFISCFLYAPARLCIFVVALRCLSDLPDSAYQTVQWTKFLPHI